MRPAARHAAAGRAVGQRLRQETRARGLDDTPREYNGAIEVPPGLFARLGEREKDGRPAASC